GEAGVAMCAGSPRLAARRLESYDGPQVTKHYRAHKSERVAWARVDVYTCSGRMVPHTFAQGCQRIRYDGVQATKTFAKVTCRMQAALAKVQGIVQGAINILAPRTYRHRYQQSSGRDPLRGPYCQSDLAVWHIGHPAYGVIDVRRESAR